MAAHGDGVIDLAIGVPSAEAAYEYATAHGATSVMDYLFRRLALDYLPYEKRSQLGILSADER